MTEPWVDCHVHLIDRSRLHYNWLDEVSEEWATIMGDYSPLMRDFAAEELLAPALPEGVSKLVHVEAAFGSDPAAETRWLQGEADRIGIPMAIVGRADLASPEVGRSLDLQMACPGFRGVRMLWGMASASPADFRRGFAELVDRDLIFEEPATYEQFPAIARLASEFPSARIVLGHCGMPLGRDPAYLGEWGRALRDLANCTNIACKISGLAMTDHRWTFEKMKEVADTVIDAFGAERVCMGSNWPVESLYFASYGDLVRTFRDLIADYPAAVRQAIMSDTASRLFRI